MKNIVLIFILMSFIGQAQQKGGRKEQLASHKVAFITKELSLTSEEAQKFWPVYNQFEAEKKEIRKKRREIMKDHAKLDQMSDAEIQKAMENMLASKQKELDLEKSYHAKFLAVLPVKKVAKLHVAEEKFKRLLLKKLAQNRQNGKQVPVDLDIED